MAALLLLGALATLPTATAQVGITPGQHEFGDLARGATTSYAFAVRNGGASAITVDHVTENDPSSAVSVSPAYATIASGGTATVTVTVTVPADADPGRHEPAVSAVERTSGAGSGAGAAARAIVVYNVAAADLAYVDVRDDGTVVSRLVNGFGSARTMDLYIKTTKDGATVDSEYGAGAAVAAGGSYFHGLTLAPALHATGTYTLTLNGTVTGGVTAMVWSESYTITRTASGFDMGSTPTPTSSGRGGGGGGGGGSSAPATSGAGSSGGGSPSAGPDAATPPLGQTFRDPGTVASNANGGLTRSSGRYDLAAGDQVALEWEEEGTIQSVELRVREPAGDVRLRVTAVPTPSDRLLPTAVGFARYYEIKADSGDSLLPSGALDRVLLRFRVETESLRTHGIDPEDVVIVHEFPGTGWFDEPTRHTGSSGAYEVYESETRSLSLFAAVDRHEVAQAFLAPAPDETGEEGDPLPPTIRSFDVPAGQLSGDVTFTYDASDPSGLASVVLFVDGLRHHKTTATGSFTFDSTEVSDGVHTFEIVVTDQAGNPARSVAVDRSVSNGIGTTRVGDATTAWLVVGSTSLLSFLLFVAVTRLRATARRQAPPVVARPSSTTLLRSGDPAKRTRRVQPAREDQGT